jgi:outer membrane protein OmpA-like peptidoglycan-associated protein
MKQFVQHPLRRAAWATFLAAAPLWAHAGDGPYIGIQGGANWESPQNLLQHGNVDDTLHFKTGWIGGVTTGYSYANGFRPELELDYRRNDLSRDAFGFAAGGHEDAETVFGNLWYDFKAPTGYFSVVHPYVGGGVGGVRFANRDATVGLAGFGNDYATVFGYQGGAGIGFDLTPNLTLSADYRYLESDHGHFDKGAIGGTVDARYRAQTAMVGLRLSFGEAPPEPAAAPPPPPPELPPPPPPPPPAPVCHPPAGFQVDANCHIIEQSLVVRAVDFEFNKALLTLPAQQTLDQVTAALAAQPELSVEIQGHTDSVGSAAYNLRLSQKRADAVKTYLVGKGVSAASLTAKGYGKDRPIASNDSEEGRAQNRRVQFEVSNHPAHLKVMSEGATAASTDAALQGQAPAPHPHHKKKVVAAPSPASGQPAQ